MNQLQFFHYVLLSQVCYLQLFLNYILKMHVQNDVGQMKKDIGNSLIVSFLFLRVQQSISYLILVTPPENYSKQQINSIIDVAINIIQPILNHSVNEVLNKVQNNQQIAEGTVMVSCTLNAIPSFLPLVIPHIPVFSHSFSHFIGLA